MVSKCQNGGMEVILKKLESCIIPGNNFFFSKFNRWQKIMYVCGMLACLSMIPLIFIIILKIRKRDITLFVYTLGNCGLFLFIASSLSILVSSKYILITFSDYIGLFIFFFIIMSCIAAYAKANSDKLELPRITITDKSLIVTGLLVLLLIISLIVYDSASYYQSDDHKCQSSCQKEGFYKFDIDYRDGMPNVCTCFDENGNEKEMPLA